MDQAGSWKRKNGKYSSREQSLLSFKFDYSSGQNERRIEFIAAKKRENAKRLEQAYGQLDHPSAHERGHMKTLWLHETVMFVRFLTDLAIWQF